jgi:hypothetical protein
MNRKTRQYKTASSPWFTTGKKAESNWNFQWNWMDATAIMPLARNAASEVKRPDAIAAPHKSSSTPPIQSCEPGGGYCPPRTPKSFCNAVEREHRQQPDRMT